MNKKWRKYVHERNVLCILIILVALIHSCSKDPQSDPPDTLPAPGYFVIDKQRWEFTPATAGSNARAAVADNNGPAIRHVTTSPSTPQRPYIAGLTPEDYTSSSSTNITTGKQKQQPCTRSDF